MEQRAKKKKKRKDLEPGDKSEKIKKGYKIEENTFEREKEFEKKRKKKKTKKKK